MRKPGQVLFWVRELYFLTLCYKKYSIQFVSEDNTKLHYRAVSKLNYYNLFLYKDKYAIPNEDKITNEYLSNE